MAWLRIDDGFPEHRKLLSLPRRDRWTWLELLAYVARQGNGGHVPEGVCDVLKFVTNSFLQQAVEVGLLDKDDDGYSVHDWEDYNPRDPTAAERMRRHRASRNRNGDRNGVTDDVTPTVTEPVTQTFSRARARVPSPTPTPLTQPAAQRQPEDPDPDAAAEAIGLNRVVERLNAAGWTDEQIRQASGRPGGWPRAVAWLDHAEADPSCREPGALAWTKFLGGGEPPEQQATLASGAQGTRSAKPKGHDCPHCGITKAGPASLAEHIENVHFDKRAQLEVITDTEAA